MTQINLLVNAARVVVQSTSSAVGVSAANANLVAVAGALSGMQMSGYEVVDPRMFDEMPNLSELSGGALAMAGDVNHNMPSQFSYPSVEQDVFAGLVDSNATLDFQNFFFAEATPMAPVNSYFHLANFVLESDSLFDPSHPESVSSERGNNNSDGLSAVNEIGGGQDAASEVTTDLAEPTAAMGSSIGQIKGGIAKASDTAAAGINYASSTASANMSGYQFASNELASGFLLEPSGFIYLSSGGGDVVQGSPYVDTLFGSLAGGDTLLGGTGNDSYAIYSASTQMVEDVLDGAKDIAFIGVDNYLGTEGIEQIVAIDTEAYATKANTTGPYLSGLDSGWRINGSADSQTIIGLYGADILDGKGGSDLLIGGAGDDVYFYTGTETIVEASNQGRDIVKTSANLSLSENTEVGVVLASASDVSVTGNALDNLLVGNDSANNLSGGAGADTLVSGGGGDILTGGAGADTFILNSQDSYLGEITDFESGQDHISLLNSDPSITLSMAPTDGFTGVAGQLWSVDGGLQIDWNGDAQFDALLLINEAPTLADLTLVDHNHIPYF